MSQGAVAALRTLAFGDLETGIWAPPWAGPRRSPRSAPLRPDAPGRRLRARLTAPPREDWELAVRDLSCASRHTQAQSLHQAEDRFAQPVPGHRSAGRRRFRTRGRLPRAAAATRPTSICARSTRFGRCSPGLAPTTGSRLSSLRPRAPKATTVTRWRHRCWSPRGPSTSPRGASRPPTRATASPPG